VLKKKKKKKQKVKISYKEECSRLAEIGSIELHPFYWSPFHRANATHRHTIPDFYIEKYYLRLSVIPCSTLET
jgi:hypothetical protein